MIVEARVTIRGSREAVWAAIADIGNASDFVSGIERIEVLEKPATGLVGLRWLETRILFGDPATVEKRITESVEGESYATRAESDGFVFVCTRRIGESGGETVLAESHETRPLGFVARLKSIPLVVLFRGVVRKAILKDLNDIKAAVERG